MVNKPEQLEFFSLLVPDPVCLYCNRSFKKTTYNKKYCSVKCFRKNKPKYKYKSSDLNKKNKICKICNKTLPINQFNICDKSGSRRGKCKICYAEHKQKRKGNLEEYKKEKLYREELHQLQKKNKRKCRLCLEIKSIDDFHNSYTEKVFYNKKSYCKKCARNQYMRPYLQSPRGKQKKQQWDKNYFSKPEIKQKRSEKHMHRYHNDIEYKILYKLRSRIKNIFKTKNIKKLNRTIDLLGCTLQKARKHLESQFKEGMTWENHGRYGWHIDHIIPCASFDLTDPEQQKKCFNYKNLQPLWWHENLSKGTKII